MRKAITVLLSALLLSGCMAQWPSNKTGARWKEGPNLGPAFNTMNNPEPASVGGRP